MEFWVVSESRGFLVDFSSVSGGFCGSGRFSVHFWVVWGMCGGFLVVLAGFRWNSGWSRGCLVDFLSVSGRFFDFLSWILWFWAVFDGILGGLVDFYSGFLVGFWWVVWFWAVFGGILGGNGG